VYLVDAQGHLRLVWDYTQVTTDAARIAQDLRAVMK
jgi:protein SCO1/2